MASPASPALELRMFDWKARPLGSTLIDLDDMPVVMLPGGACVSAKTGSPISSGRVMNDGIEVSEAAFEFMVNSSRPAKPRMEAQRGELARKGDAPSRRGPAEPRLQTVPVSDNDSEPTGLVKDAGQANGDTED